VPRIVPGVQTCRSPIFLLLLILHGFHSQIVDHSNMCQLPEAMKVADALVQCAAELLFDASGDAVEVRKMFSILR